MEQHTEDADQKSDATGGVGFLIIDMINDLAFPGAEPLLRAAGAMVDDLLGFRSQADEAGVPTLYVNDNFGHWRSERSAIVERAQREDSPARAIAKALSPRSSDFFVIKPRFSGFYATNLQVLLPQLGISRLILSGVATDICVLFTATDAYMREYDLWVPRNLVASDDPKRDAWALEIMRNSMGARTEATTELTLKSWLQT